MKIEKITTVSIKTTNGTPVEIGETVVFEAHGKSFIGVFAGFGKKGTLTFTSPIPNSKATFSVLPKSIDTMHHAFEFHF